MMLDNGKKFGMTSDIIGVVTDAEAEAWKSASGCPMDVLFVDGSFIVGFIDVVDSAARRAGHSEYTNQKVHMWWQDGVFNAEILQ